MSKLTLETIAELAGVSRSTASRVLRNQGSVSHKARLRVMEVIRETGYSPNPAARSLAGQRTNIIGLVIAEPAQSLFGDPYFPNLIQGVTQAANQSEQTLSLFLFNDKDDEYRLSQKLINNQMFDGLLVTGTHLDDPLVPALISGNVPFVLIGRHENPNVNYIDVDSQAGAHAAVSHLIRAGYKRIGTITGHRNNQAALDRLDGYQNALRGRGRQVIPDLIAYGDYSEDSGYDCMAMLLEQKIDAVFVASDTMAIGAMNAIKTAGLSVPDDIAMVAFDDFPISARVEPPLTTIRQPVRSSGIMAVEALLDVIENGSIPPRRISLPTELIVRASCGTLHRTTRGES